MKRHLWLCLVVITTFMLGACEKRPVVDSAMSADGTAIRYEVAGSGDVALVFVHGWTGNRSVWDAQVAYFAPRYRVVRIDLAGHGESGTERKVYTVPAFGADVAAVVDRLSLQRVILVGHSLGGPVSLEAEKRLGARVLGVVGVDSFYTAFDFPKDAKAAKEFTAKFLQPFEDNFPETTEKFVRSIFAPGADPALVEAYAKKAAAADKTMAISALRELFAWYRGDAAAAFQRVGAKLHNINGDPKGENKPRHASVVLIAGALHFPAQEKPAEFNRALDELARQMASAAAK